MMACPSLGAAADWAFKGEGNANVVYQYVGRLPHLVGKVLKVRKASAAQSTGANAQLEAAVWEPLLGPAAAPGGDPMARELLYVQRCLVPLLGVEHVPEQEPVQVTQEFLRQLARTPGSPRSAAHAPDPSNPAAVLMPDVTTFPQLPQPTSAACDGAADVCGGSPMVVSSPPALCVEIKPKCGFLGACETVHPDNRIKHSRSRYQLHQLLKVSEGKVAEASSYDPLDLFSEDPLRMLRALRALFDHPQNNLKLFWAGRPVGVRQGLQAWAAADRGLGSAGSNGSSGSGGDGAPGNLASCSSSSEEAPVARPELVAAPADEEREQLLGLLLEVLTQEGVLGRLLDAQRQCPYDIEGIHTLYTHLLAAAAEQEECCGSGSRSCSQWQELRQQQQQKRQQAEGASRAAAAVEGSSNTGGTSAVAAAPSCNGEPSPGSSGGSGSESTSSPSTSAVNHAAVQQLLGLPRQEAHAVLRRYVVSTTAKDCALMVSLQPLCGDSPAAPAPPPELPQEAEPAAVRAARARGERVVRHPRSGRWYRCRLAFVDLDLKPLSKIPQHHALDQRILAAARRAAAAEAAQ